MKNSEKSKYWENKRFIVANFLDKFKCFCWADLAMFGMGYGIKKLFSTSKKCKAESKELPCKSCYCGKFYDGRLATIEDYISNVEPIDELPF